MEAFKLGLLGVVADRVPRPLLAKGLRAGVGWRLGVCLLSGDSGRGSDGLRGLSCGLCDLAPCPPTDCENFRAPPGLVPLSPVLYDGVPGVAGKESRDIAGESRFSARCIGRNMPAPGIVVLK